MTDPLYRIKPLEWTECRNLITRGPSFETRVFGKRCGVTLESERWWIYGIASPVGWNGCSAHEDAKAEIERLYRDSLLRHLEPTEGNP